MSLPLRIVPILAAIMLLGCSAQEPPMSSAERWSAIDELKGLRVCRNYEKAVKKAHLSRHPKHDTYIPIPESIPLTAAESEEYARLDELLHDEMRRVSHEHFDKVPVPKEIQEANGDETYFTPFTYQVEDWYGPSYECYIVVLTDFISADLLRRFQSLLQGEHHDWCIMVVGSDEPDFDSNHEMAVFSDQILVPEAAARAMDVPEDHH